MSNISSKKEQIFWDYSPAENSRISPGWQSRTSQIASNVEKRMALALPVFRIDRLDMVIPTFSESSVRLIFRLASITSRFTIIAMIYTVRSWSFCMGMAFCRNMIRKKRMPSAKSDSEAIPLVSGSPKLNSLFRK